MRRIAGFTAATLMVAGLAWGAAPAWAQSDVHCPTDNLQTAIDNASPGSRIDVHGTCVGTFTVHKNLTLDGISNGAPNSNAVLDSLKRGTVLTVSPGVTATVRGMTIQNGLHARGGGIINHFGSTLTLINSTVSGNTAAHDAAGILNSGTLTVSGSTVSGNIAGFGGGGIFNTGTLTVEHSLVSGNAARNGGGGIYNNGGSVTLKGGRVVGNAANPAGGGGIENNSGTVTLDGTKVLGNSATTRGGGILNRSGKLTLNRSEVSGNVAGNNGGGIYDAGGFVTLSNSAVSGNNPDNCVSC